MGTNLVSACQKPLWQLPSSKGQHNKHKRVLPKVLLVGPPKNMGVLKPQSPQNYKLSKPWDGSLSLKEFMNENNYEGSMFEALICSVWDAPIDANVLQQLPCLKLVVTTTAGTDHIDIKECHRRGIQVANVGSLHTEDVADMAVALLFGVLTNIVSTRMRSSACNSPIPSTFKLGGKRIGIVGLGSIGIQVAKRLEAFGCNIAYHSRNKKTFISYPFYSNIVELATGTQQHCHLSFVFVFVSGQPCSGDLRPPVQKRLSSPSASLRHHALQDVQKCLCKDVFNLLPNLNVADLIKAFAVKTNDMMLVIYLSSLIRSVIALHNLINNKMLNKEHERAEDSKSVTVPSAAA
ncbi:hypothetical protein Fmac_018002 [Flemingia macrophylla]|uniref:Uncharacterized protein n=1 Tax=Flemingia macrophylla TaxID=520843 RepID=A0ABD1M3W3_9FABA